MNTEYPIDVPNDLLRLKHLSKHIHELRKMENDLIDRLVENGVTWQELAQYSKNQAIILYKRMYHHDDLLECARIVEDYLKKNSDSLPARSA